MKDASRMHKLPRRISNCQRDRLGLLAFTVVYRKMEQSIEPKSRLPFNRTSRTAEQCVASGVTQTPFSLPNLRSWTTTKQNKFWRFSKVLPTSPRVQEFHHKDWIEPVNQGTHLVDRGALAVDELPAFATTFGRVLLNRFSTTPRWNLVIVYSLDCSWLA